MSAELNIVPDPAARTRDGGGRYSAEVATADRDHEAMALRAQGLSFRAIARRLSVSTSTAHDMVSRAMAEVRRAPAEDFITMELLKLDRMEAHLNRIINEGSVYWHPVTGQPVSIATDDGKSGPRTDPKITLAALEQLRKISEMRLRLHGVGGQPSRVNVLVVNPPTP